VIINARMYSATVAARDAWNAILGWAAARAGLCWSIHDYPPPAPLAALWNRSDLGCAMMCGLPFSQRQPRPTLVAAPVPSHARYGGRPIYFTDVAVRADAAYATLEDTFGGVVGFTVRDSMSGYVALRRHLLPYRAARGRPLYRHAQGGFVNARSIIGALADGRIDVGPLDSYYHDLLAADEPALAAKVRVIASTEAAPIPPLVATAAIPREDLANLRAALDAAATAPELSVQRRTLLLDRFAVPAAATYDVLREAAESARRYPESW
jgi:ABC-type phosphate/phosphonate transport system substrate-binding protein